MFDWLEHELLTLSATDYGVLYGTLVVATAALLFYVFITSRRYRFMEGTATSLIRSAAQGQVELKGLAEWLPEGMIRSPFSGNRCVWYHCTIEKRKRSGKRTTWTNILDERSSELFRIVDDTGECIIDPDHAHVIPETDLSWYGGDRSASLRPPQRKQWILLGFGKYRFRERLITPATPIYALGWFRTLQHHPSSQSIDQQVKELVSQWKIQPGRYLREFDLDQNGKIQRDEWKAIQAAARNKVVARINRENRPQHILSRPEDRRLPYILSAQQEEILVAKKQLLSYLSVAAAFLVFSSLVLFTSIRSPLAW